MRGHGEIAYLAEVARPHIGVITNVGAAHLERLHSLDDIARAKGELFAGLGARRLGGAARDDPLITAQAAHVRADRRLTFGGRARGRRARARGRAGGRARAPSSATRREHVPLVVRLPLAGAHNAANGAAALAVARGGRRRAAGARRRRWRRSRCRRTDRRCWRPGGRTILDDCYNANPASMSAALATVVAAVGGAGGWARAFAVLGDMLEVGPDAEELHRALGREAGVRLAGVVALGDFAGGGRGRRARRRPRRGPDAGRAARRRRPRR